MKITAYAICYNEEKLLPYYLRHYSAFCDRIVIYDNYSTDGGPEICRQNPKVELIRYDTGDRIRDDIYLQIKNNCWKNSDADWVIVGDIDELVYHPDIREVLAESGAAVILPDLYNMYSKYFPETEDQIWEEVTRGIQGGGKANIFRPGIVKEMNYDPGCHLAYPHAFDGPLIADNKTEIKTLHMKFLSIEYVIERKRLLQSRLSDLNKQMGWGIHYNTPDDVQRMEFEEGLKKATVII